MVSHGGQRAYLGTNPVCIAVPSAEGEPVCVDMATSIIPLNRVMNARRDGVGLPPGAAVDDAGQPTTNADAARALMPAAGHKGYALAFLIDLLCGPLNGMPFGPHIPKMYGDVSARRELGALMIALDPARFGGGDMLAQTAAAMAREVRQQPAAAADGEVMAPGDPEVRSAAERAVEGIPVEAGLQQQVREWPQRLGLDSPLPATVVSAES